MSQGSNGAQGTTGTLAALGGAPRGLSGGVGDSPTAQAPNKRAVTSNLNMSNGYHDGFGVSIPILVGMDQLGRIDLTVLYPAFVAKLRQLIKNCNARGAKYIATSGLRTFEEQDALYAKGRTAPGGIVTQARGGQSPHNFGIAVDFSYTTSLRPVKIDDKEKNYRILAEEANALGLVSGLTWNSSFTDPNHTQWAVRQIGYTWADLTAAYRKGGYPAVYRILDDWQAKHGVI